MIKISEEHALKNNPDRVIKIGLVIGEYLGYVGDSILMYFDEISKNTM